MNDFAISECILHGSYAEELSECPTCERRNSIAPSVVGYQYLSAAAPFEIKTAPKQKGKVNTPKANLVKPIRFFVAINPEVKERPRFGGGKVYTAKQTSDYEKKLKKAIKEAIEAADYIMPSKDTPLLAIVQFYRSDRRGVDTDNLLKAVFDAGNKLLYPDDKQIKMHVVTVERGVGQDRAGVSIEIRYYFEELGIMDNLEAGYE